MDRTRTVLQGLGLGLLVGALCHFTSGVLVYASGTFSRAVITEFVRVGMISGLLLGPLLAVRSWGGHRARAWWVLAGLAYSLYAVLVNVRNGGLSFFDDHWLPMLIAAVGFALAGAMAGTVAVKAWERRTNLLAW